MDNTLKSGQLGARGKPMVPQLRIENLNVSQCDLQEKAPASNLLMPPLCTRCSRIWGKNREEMPAGGANEMELVRKKRGVEDSLYEILEKGNEELQEFFQSLQDRYAKLKETRDTILSESIQEEEKGADAENSVEFNHSHR